MNYILTAMFNGDPTVPFDRNNPAPPSHYIYNMRVLAYQMRPQNSLWYNSTFQILINNILLSHRYCMEGAVAKYAREQAMKAQTLRKGHRVVEHKEFGTQTENVEDVELKAEAETENCDEKKLKYSESSEDDLMKQLAFKTEEIKRAQEEKEDLQLQIMCNQAAKLNFVNLEDGNTSQSIHRFDSALMKTKKVIYDLEDSLDYAFQANRILGEKMIQMQEENQYLQMDNKRLQEALIKVMKEKDEIKSELILMKKLP